MNAVRNNIVRKMICFSALAMMFAGCSKESIRQEREEEPVTRLVSFKIAQAQDYSSPIFDSVQAEVTLTVSRANKADGSGQTVLWDTIIPMKDIRSYPGADCPLFIRKTIDSVQESRDAVTASRIIRYLRAGNQPYMQASGEVVPAAKIEFIYEVNL